MKAVLSSLVAILLACGLCAGQAYAWNNDTTNNYYNTTNNDNRTYNQGGDAKQAQGQMQGQAQLQGQAQKQTAVGVGVGIGVSGASAGASSGTFAPNTQTTEVFNEDKRELPGIVTGPVAPVVAYKGPFKKGVAGDVKPWVLIKDWDASTIAGFYSAFDGASCNVYKTTSNEYPATEKLTAGKIAKPVIAIIQCNAENDNELWGDVATKALAVGATAVEEAAYAVMFASKAKGWSFGIGGGATVIGRDIDDNKGGAVGGGIGMSSVEAYPVEKIKAIFLAR